LVLGIGYWVPFTIGYCYMSSANVQMTPNKEWTDKYVQMIPYNRIHGQT
jgi:hypothetical protein